MQAEQFIMHKNNETDIIAGFPWYNSITRQTFISLPGLCLSIDDKSNCRKVLNTYLNFLKNGFFPIYSDQISDIRFCRFIALVYLGSSAVF